MGQRWRNIRSGGRTVAAAALVAGGCLLLGAVRPAGAAFPGANGHLVLALFDHGIKCGSLPMVDASNLFAINADGTGKTALTTAGTDATIEEPSFSPDGSRLAFIRRTCTGADLVVSDSSGGGASTIRTQAGGNLFSPFWSPDGTRIGFSDGNNVFVGQADGTGVVLIESSSSACRGSSWRSDGARILIWCDSDTTNPVLATVAPDGSGRVDLGAGAAGDWAASGTRIAFTMFTDTGNEAWVMDADGTHRSQLPATNPDVIRWSPDGTRLVLAGYGDPVVVMHTDGSGPQDVPNTDGGAAGAAWQVAPGTSTSSSSTSTTSSPASSSSSTTTSSTTLAIPAGGSTKGAGNTGSQSALGSLSPSAAGAAAAGTTSSSVVDQTPPSGPPSAQRGGRIDVTGIGFQPFTPGDVMFASTPRKVGSFVTHADGSATASVVVPADAATGPHEILLQGVDPGGRPRTVSISVVVLGGTGDLATTGPSGTALALAMAAVVLAVIVGRVPRAGARRHRS